MDIDYIITQIATFILIEENWKYLYLLIMIIGISINLYAIIGIATIKKKVRRKLSR